MTEDKDVSSQIHDNHMLINDLVIEDINLSEPLMDGYLIDPSRLFERLQK